MKRSFVLSAATLLIAATTLWLTGATAFVAQPFTSPSPTADGAAEQFTSPSPTADGAAGQFTSPTPTTEQAAAEPLTPEQAQLVAAKKQAAQAAGIQYSQESPNKLTFPQPVRTDVKKVRLTRQDIQAAFEQSLQAMQERLKAISEQQDPPRPRWLLESISTPRGPRRRDSSLAGSDIVLP